MGTLVGTPLENSDIGRSTYNVALLLSLSINLFECEM